MSPGSHIHGGGALVRHVQALNQTAAGLVARGFEEPVVVKILGRNLQRVLETALRKATLWITRAVGASLLYSRTHAACGLCWRVYNAVAARLG